MKIRLSLDQKSVQNAIDRIGEYRKGLRAKAEEISRRLAEYGAMLAENAYDGVPYTGDRNVYVSVEERPDGYAIIADGETVLFLEFGAGITMGYGHPQNADFGMGPGTYPIPPGKGHWNDPKGWYTPQGEHTYGNPPSMAMYNASQELRKQAVKIAQEVFEE